MYLTTTRNRLRANVLSLAAIPLSSLILGMLAWLCFDWLGASAHAAPADTSIPAVDVAAPATTSEPAKSESPEIQTRPVIGEKSQFEDPTEPFVPLKDRNTRDVDHVRALALFAAGRVAEQKQNYAEALRSYQRAYRFDPRAVPALRMIVPLAFNLGREEEGVRYALLLAERDPADANLLRRLAMYLTEEGKSERALGLYEKAMALDKEKTAKPSASTVLMWMEMGRLEFLAKKFDDAATNFALVIGALADPKKYDLTDEVQAALLNKGELTYQLFGESFLEANRPDDALAAFTKANTFKSDEALELFNQARVDALRKQPAQALAKLETYIAKKYASQGTPPYDLLVNVLTDLGQTDHLAERLEKFRSEDPENIPLSFFLAERYRKAAQLDKAAPIYEALIAQRRERPPLEAITGLVDVYRQQQNAEKLLTLLGGSVGRVGSLSPLGESGDLLLDDKSLCKAIIVAAKQQIPAPPVSNQPAAEIKAPTDETEQPTPTEKDSAAEKDSEAQKGDKPATAAAERSDYGNLMAAALIAMANQDYDNAQLLFDAALLAEGVKPAEAVVSWGLELFANGQYDRAIQVFERGLKDKILPADNPALTYYLAGSLEMAGRTDEALASARKAADLKPDAPRFASRAGWIQFHAKRLEAARQSYLALIEQYDKSYDSQEIRDVMRDARLVLSNIAAMQGNMDQAEEWLEQVLDEFPEDAGALNDLGYLWADGGKHLDRARDMIQQAVNEDPTNMAYRDSLGWVLYRLDKFPEAVAELKAAAGVPDPDGVILDHLAEAQLLNGEIAAAIETWRRALNAFESEQDTEQADEIREKLKAAEAQATEKAAVPEPPAVDSDAVDSESGDSPAASDPSQS